MCYVGKYICMKMNLVLAASYYQSHCLVPGVCIRNIKYY